MLNNKEIIDAILRDGTSQKERLPVALNPEYIQLDERKMEDFLSFISDLAEQINFYDETNTINGNWQKKKKKIDTTDKINTLITNWGKDQQTDPHLALLLTFLKLYEFARDDINKITEKHLNFYYKKVLQLTPKDAVPDYVHVIFELAKNVSSYKLEKGTKLKAGKDSSGNELFYETTKEVVLNKATIYGLKSIFVDKSDKTRIYAAPQANSADGKGKKFESDTKWAPFGVSQKDKADDQKTMIKGIVGLAVSSPQLLLSEGSRKITLTFSLIGSSSIGNQNLNNNFKIYLSGEKEWIQAKNIKAETLNNKLLINFELTPEYGAIVAFDSKTLEGGYSTNYPVLRLELNNDYYNYELFQGAFINSMSITVDVSGVKNLILQNDFAPLAPDKPFTPFGASPKIGSTFYIGHNEVFQKKLDTLSFNLLWDGLPEDTNGFSDYYQAYPGTYANGLFKANLFILDEGEWKPETPDVNDEFGLFNSIGNKLETDEFTRNANMSRIGVNRDPKMNSFDRYDLTLKKGFVKLELKTTDFGHSVFPELYTDAVIKKANAGSPDTVSLPNPPYTPTLKSLSINYSSTQDYNFSTDNKLEQFYHIEPFGVRKITNESTPSLLPDFQEEGYLYIGLKNFVPPQNISILFQVLDGSGDLSLSLESEDVKWSYLAGNKWIVLDDLKVLADTTNGFQTSGIVELTIGSEATKTDTLILKDYHWIRASVNSNSAAANLVVDVQAQGVESSFVIDKTSADQNAEHFKSPLTEKTISKLAVKDSSVKSITQPYTSINGKSFEKSFNYYTRVSERLRHKKRAITLWDFERLVLEEFPSIYKVKCLNHTDQDSFLAPGNVTIITIQDLTNKNAVNPHEPKTSSITLHNIREYLKKFVSPFVNIHVENPVYEKLLVHCKVGFVTGKDPGFYGNQLNEDIKVFLSPWAYEEGEDIIFGGKVYRSDVLYFIENRDYVDYVNDFKLYHIFDGRTRGGIGDMAIDIDFIIRALNPPGIGEMVIEDTFIIGEDVESTRATSPKSILVSAENHYIEVLRDNECAVSTVSLEGIGQMIIGFDFIVT